MAVAVSEGEMQQRSYPNSFGRHQGTAGYEFVQQWDLPGNARRMGEEVVALLSAPQCPSGVTTIILDGPQLGLQIHESCGHPIELDRVFGTEAAFAGTSFLTPDKLNTFRYGSEIVNLTADATIPGGLGTFGYDDEGVPAQRVNVVRDGTFVGYLSSRETAARLGMPASGGAMRASGWNRIPLIRMTNISLMPGDWTLDALIEDTKDGIYMETNKSFSIDQQRVNAFADATEDHQWIHVDPQRAAAGPFGTTIAHGFLTLSVLPYLIFQTYRVEGATMTINYGLNKVRFPAPVPVGSRVRAEVLLAEVAEVMSKSQGAVKALQHSAIVALRKAFLVVPGNERE